MSFFLNIILIIYCFYATIIKNKSNKKLVSGQVDGWQKSEEKYSFRVISHKETYSQKE